MSSRCRRTARSAEDQQDRLRNDPEEAAAAGRHGGRGVGDSRGCRRNHGHPPRRPQEQIVDFAETNPVDMIIVGTAGRSGLDHLISGSVAEEIVRNAPVPVPHGSRAIITVQS